MKIESTFIVGGSSGIGLACAKLLAARGSDLAIFARRGDVVAEAVAEIETVARDAGQTSKILGLPLDATDYTAVKQSFSQAIAEIGVPDLLINAAGRAVPHRFLEMDKAQISETYEANVLTAWNAAHLLAPDMVARGSGAIVNISSLAGLIGVYGYTDYSFSKAGLIGFSESLRCELKPLGIKVQVFCPPDTDTPGFEAENATKPHETRAMSEGGGLMSADDAATALLKGLQTSHFVTLANFESHMFYALRRIFPRLSLRVIDGMVRKAQRGK